MLDYLTSKRSKAKVKSRSPSPAPAPAAVDTIDTDSETPVLTAEDEEFLQRIANEEEGTPPELPERPGPPLPPRPPRPQDLPEAGDTQGNEAQVVLFEGAEGVEEPEDLERNAGEEGTKDGGDKDGGKEKEKDKETDKKRSKWSWLRRDSRDAKRKTAGDDLMSAAEGLKSPDAQPNEDGVVSEPEAQKEEEEMSRVLDNLNLAAVNNRVFSISKESQELLRKSVTLSIGMSVSVHARG